MELLENLLVQADVDIEAVGHPIWKRISVSDLTQG